MNVIQGKARHFRLHRKNLPLRIVLLVIITSILEVGGLHFLKRLLYEQAIDASVAQVLNQGVLLLTIAIMVVAAFVIFLCVRTSDEMVNRDALTQVANSDKISAYGVRKQILGSLPNYTCIFLNIKDFKYVNELVGNVVGHQVLKDYALQIKDFLGKKNFIGRLGGDNFFIYVHHEELDKLLDFLSPVRVYVDMPEGLKELKLYCRCGLYCPQPKENIGAIMNASSTALIYAKRSGTEDMVWFEQRMLDSLIAEKEILNTYQAALENGEFRATFQPKVDLMTERICGSEALICWEKNGKILPPDTFVPVLEQAGRIVALDFFMFEEVCKALEIWKKAGIPMVKISSNFSRFHLKNPNLAEDVLAIVDKYDIDPRYLEIEITESSEYENIDAMCDFANRMHERGIGISIDDFGTGHSSLALLYNLEADVVKLDKSFLQDLDDAKDRQFIENIIHMIKDLDKKVICEGVETKEQADFLRQAHCDMAQGFYYDRALSKEIFTERLQKLAN